MPSKPPPTASLPSGVTSLVCMKAPVSGRRRTSPPSSFTTLTTLSPAETSACVPMPRKCTEVTSFLKPPNDFFCSPLRRFQIFTALSAPTLASTRPFRCQLTPSTWPVCPSSARSSLPRLVSKIRAKRSVPPEANRLPSGEKASEQTVSLCASGIRNTSEPSSTFQM